MLDQNGSFLHRHTNLEGYTIPYYTVLFLRRNENEKYFRGYYKIILGYKIF